MHAKSILQLTALATLALVSHADAASPSVSIDQLVLQAPPTTSVGSVAVSPDGLLVATASGEGGVRLYDAQTGVMLRSLGDVGDRCVVFMPDGRSLTAAGFHLDRLVKRVDVNSGTYLRTYAGHSPIEMCATAVSPNGKLLASAGRDSEILVWDADTGALRYRIDGAPAVAIVFSPDGQTLAGGGRDRMIRLYNAMTGQLRQTLKGHGDCVATLAYSPNGKLLASGSCDWDNHRGRNTAEFAWRDPGCVSEWKLWDAASGELRRSGTEPGRLLSLAFAPNSESLASAIGKDVKLYDLRVENPGRVVTSFPFDATCVAYTPDGTAILGGSHDQTVKRVNIATGQVEWQLPGSFEQINSIALSTDGQLLATGSSDRRFAVRTLKAGDPNLKPGAIRIWDVRSGRLLRRLANELPNEQVMAVAISPDGNRVVSGGANQQGAGVLHLHNPHSGQRIWSLADHGAEVLAVAFAPDGTSLASASADGLVKLRDPQTGAVVHALPNHRGGATSLAFSTDGVLLACGEGKGGTCLWDVRTGRRLQTCQAAASRADSVTTDRLFTPVAFKPRGGALLSSIASVGNTYSEPVRQWDISTGALKREFNEPDISGRPVVLSPDGSILAAGGKTIKLWDAASGKLLRELIGYLKKTQAIAFSEDGRLIYSGGSYGTINAWEVASGRHLITMFAFPAADGAETDDWVAHTHDGFYEGSPGAQRYLAWRIGNELRTAASFGGLFNRADRVSAALTRDTATAP